MEHREGTHVLNVSNTLIAWLLCSCAFLGPFQLFILLLPSCLVCLSWAHFLLIGNIIRPHQFLQLLQIWLKIPSFDSLYSTTRPTVFFLMFEQSLNSLFNTEIFLKSWSLVVKFLNTGGQQFTLLQKRYVQMNRINLFGTPIRSEPPFLVKTTQG